jgi:hypothetical protein
MFATPPSLEPGRPNIVVIMADAGAQATQPNASAPGGTLTELAWRIGAKREPSQA